jgi:hypothetical protein
LKEQDVDSVYIEGNDEIMDILRLTCIEAGITISEADNSCMLNFNGQDFKFVMKYKKKN